MNILSFLLKLHQKKQLIITIQAALLSTAMGSVSAAPPETAEPQPITPEINLDSSNTSSSTQTPVAEPQIVGEPGTLLLIEFDLSNKTSTTHTYALSITNSANWEMDLNQIPPTITIAGQDFAHLQLGIVLPMTPAVESTITVQALSQTDPNASLIANMKVVVEESTTATTDSSTNSPGLIIKSFKPVNSDLRGQEDCVPSSILADDCTQPDDGIQGEMTAGSFGGQIEVWATNSQAIGNVIVTLTHPRAEHTYPTEMTQGRAIVTLDDQITKAGEYYIEATMDGFESSSARSVYADILNVWSTGIPTQLQLWSTKERIARTDFNSFLFPDNQISQGTELWVGMADEYGNVTTPCAPITNPITSVTECPTILGEINISLQDANSVVSDSALDLYFPANSTDGLAQARTNDNILGNHANELIKIGTTSLVAVATDMSGTPISSIAASEPLEIQVLDTSLGATVLPAFLNDQEAGEEFEAVEIRLLSDRGLWMVDDNNNLIRPQGEIVIRNVMTGEESSAFPDSNNKVRALFHKETYGNGQYLVYDRIGNHAQVLIEAGAIIPAAVTETKPQQNAPEPTEETNPQQSEPTTPLDPTEPITPLNPTEPNPTEPTTPLNPIILENKQQDAFESGVIEFPLDPSPSDPESDDSEIGSNDSEDPESDDSEPGSNDSDPESDNNIEETPPLQSVSNCSFSATTNTCSLKDVAIEEGASISGVTVTGTIENEGLLSNITVEPDAVVSGGKLTGSVENQGTISDFEFVGKEIVGGTLGGVIHNNSKIGGAFKDVQLAPNTYVKGGAIKGEIVGSKHSPTLLEDVTVEEGTQLSGVVIGEGVELAEEVELAEDVIQNEDQVRIIVGLEMATSFESASLSSSAVQDQRKRIVEVQQAFRDSLQASLPFSAESLTEQADDPIDKVFKIVPYVVMEVNTTQLAEIRKNSLVTHIEIDEPALLSLHDSVPLIGASNMHSLGYSGQGQTVAILDTGVDGTHSALANKVVAEACYSTIRSGIKYDSATLCPNNKPEQIGEGAGIPCSEENCEHGTHVAGIVAANGTITGVAKDANLIAIQVYSRIMFKSGFSYLGAFPSDQALGLERVLLLHEEGLPIASVNMSLSSIGSYYSGPCDDDVRKQLIDKLRSVGIAAIIASGNGGSSEGISRPSCISSAISVGATNKDDSVATDYSNSVSSNSNNGNPILDLLAPGTEIISTLPNEGSGPKSGTSMAAPHVAGAWAILKAIDPTKMVGELLTIFKNTGIPITDPRNDLTTPRIQVDAAWYELVCGSPTVTSSENSGWTRPLAKNDIALIKAGHSVMAYSVVEVETLCIESGGRLLQGGYNPEQVPSSTPNEESFYKWNTPPQLTVKANYIYNNGLIQGVHGKDGTGTQTADYVHGGNGGNVLLDKPEIIINGPTGRIKAGRGGNDITHNSLGWEKMLAAGGKGGSVTVRANRIYNAGVIGPENQPIYQNRQWISDGGNGGIGSNAYKVVLECGGEKVNFNELLLGDKNWYNSGDAYGGSGGDTIVNADTQLHNTATGRINAGYGGDARIPLCKYTSTPGQGGQIAMVAENINFEGSAEGGRALSEPVIMMSGSNMRFKGEKEVVIFGGDNWELDLRNLNPSAITAGETITIAVGKGGVIDLRDNSDKIIKTSDKVYIFADTILLDEGIALEDLIAAPTVDKQSSKILYEVALSGPGAMTGEPGTTIPIEISVLNVGPNPDSYTLSVSDSEGWQLGSFPDTITVAGLKSEEITLEVTLPTALGATNIITVTAISQTDSNVAATTEVELIVAKKRATTTEIELMRSEEGIFAAALAETDLASIPPPLDLNIPRCSATDEINWVCNNYGQILSNARLGTRGSLAWGALAGTINSHGLISNVMIQPGTQILGGKLSGYIVNEGLIQDAEFVGAQVIGGTLSGTILNNSDVEGVFQDVHLAENTILIGGYLQGNIIGDANAPARLEQLTIEEGAYLTHVILGENVKIAGKVQFGEGVQNIPPDLESITVAELPYLGNGIVVNQNGSTLDTVAHFTGGVAVNDAPFEISTTPSLSDVVTIRGDITFDPEHLEQVTDIVVYVTYLPLEVDEELEPNYFMLDDKGKALPLNKDLGNLVPFQPLVGAIPKQIEVLIYDDLLPVTGYLEVFLGYRLSEGTVVHHVQPIELKVVN